MKKSILISAAAIRWLLLTKHKSSLPVAACLCAFELTLKDIHGKDFTLSSVRNK